MENGRCVGSITDKTFASLAAEGKTLEKLRAGDVIGESFPEVPPSTLRSVAGLMLRSAQVILIVRNGKIEGIITSDDLLWRLTRLQTVTTSRDSIVLWQHEGKASLFIHDSPDLFPVAVRKLDLRFKYPVFALGQPLFDAFGDLNQEIR